MTNFVFYTNSTLALVCLPSGASAFFSLEDAARLTGVHPEMLRYYTRVGLVESHSGKLENELCFDESALNEIRRIEHYRRHLGVGRRALPLICELHRTSERLKIELRFLRSPQFRPIR
jgi:DNA-binding transcriptional MerR regulator